MFYPHTIKGKPFLRKDLIGGSIVLQNSLALDGIDQFSTLGNVESVGAGDASWSVVFRITDKTTANMIIAKEDGTVGGTEYRVFTDTNGHLHFGIEVDAANRYEWSYLVDVSDGIYRNLQWSTNRAGNKPQVWIDGVDVSASLTNANSAGNVATGNISNTVVVNIGSRDILASMLYMPGDLMNVFMLNRNFTTDDILELQTIKQLTDYSSTITDDYRYAIPYNDGVTNPETDVSLNGNDATLINSPTYTGQPLKFET